MDIGSVFLLIGAVGTICSVIFGYVGYRNGLKKESAVAGAEQGGLKADTEYMKRRVDDVLQEQRNTNITLNIHAERITRVEESTKEAHKRLDRLEGE